jgi:hypothetical protein
METVGNFPDLASARVAQSLLEGADIHSEIPDEFLSGVDWQMNTALHGVRLRVAREDAESATLLLGDYLFTPNTAGDDIDNEYCCPACHSTTIGPPRWKRRMKALALLFPPLLLLYPLLAVATRNTVCFSCGHKWNETSTAG